MFNCFVVIFRYVFFLFLWIIYNFFIFLLSIVSSSYRIYKMDVMRQFNRNIKRFCKILLTNNKILNFRKKIIIIEHILWQNRLIHRTSSTCLIDNILQYIRVMVPLMQITGRSFLILQNLLFNFRDNNDARESKLFGNKTSKRWNFRIANGWTVT